ncbi:MAG: dTDP-4-dehydrorhamnose reductase [Granulosicoccus sp.]|nr:dTDP-4-dehydrorhamnose reductase [Granulosicoccus sp.]
MRVLITGGQSGQLKWELLRTAPEGIDIVGESAERLDIADQAAVQKVVSELKPDCIINAAAYTAVDTAEEDTDAAFLLNETAVGYLCDAALERNANFIHVSTDFVFGHSDGSPFREDAPTDPVSVYGHSKLAGEKVVMQRMPDTGLVVRTAWVYSSFGNNFVKTMLRVMKARGEVGVIADQVGSPTWANGLARALWQAALKKSSGMMHWTGAGVASWYDFAQAIAEEGVAAGLLEKMPVVNSLRTDQYPTPASRPSYSVMETTATWEALDLKPLHWRDELRAMLLELQ